MLGWTKLDEIGQGRSLPRQPPLDASQLDRFSIRKNETTKSTPRDSNRGRVPYAAFDYFLDGKSFFLHGQRIYFHSHVFVELYIASLRSLVL